MHGTMAGVEVGEGQAVKKTLRSIRTSGTTKPTRAVHTPNKKEHGTVRKTVAVIIG